MTQKKKEREQRRLCSGRLCPATLIPQLSQHIRESGLAQRSILLEPLHKPSLQAIRSMPPQVHARLHFGCLSE